MLISAPILARPAVYNVIGTAQAQSAPITQESPEKQASSSVTNQIFAEHPILERIAACETTGSVSGTPTQFMPDGSILWGEDPVTKERIKRDEGILQINTYVWGSLAAKMGDDLATASGNIEFGEYLFSKYGTAPWTASENCWEE